ncbi:hypothetical protein ACF0H5_001745 [Mactra antiquata]
MGLDKTLLVDEVDERFICGLCDQVLVNPVYAGCNHIFCKSCVSRKLRSKVTKSVCPSCSAKLTDDTTDTTIEFKLNLLHLKIRCSHNCDSTFVLADLPEHLDYCPLAPVECDFKPKGCKKTVRRKDFEKHLDECDFRTVECEACGHVTMYQDLFTHQSRTRCLERKLKQQVIRERKASSQEINRHRQRLCRDITRLDQQQRKTFSNHYRALSYRKMSKQSPYPETDDVNIELSPRDSVFLTDEVKGHQEEDYEEMEQELTNTRNDMTNHKTPHSSRCDYAVQICGQCDKKFRAETNSPSACKWHVGVSI